MKILQMKDGFRLHLLPSDKFKTLHARAIFSEPLTKQGIAERSLLSQLMDLSTQKFDTQRKMALEEARLYATRVSTSSSRLGEQSLFQVSMTLPNPKYIQGADLLLEDAFDFFHEVMTAPLIEDGAFDSETFEREKEILLDDIESIIDNKMSYASMKLNEYYYEDPRYQVLSSGAYADVEALTAESLAEAYDRLVNENNLDIIILGDFDEDEIVKIVEGFDFKARYGDLFQPYYHREDKPALEQYTEVQKINQSKLNFALSHPAYYLSDTYFDALVFNSLFGGDAHSKLFQNVREKASLAYYCSSSLNTFTGQMVIQTGIDGDTVDQTRSIIKDQLEAMRGGDFTEEEIDQSKKLVINRFLQEEDSPQAIMVSHYYSYLVNKDNYQTDDRIRAVEKVSKEDIIRFAQSVNPQTEFFLRGEM